MDKYYTDDRTIKRSIHLLADMMTDEEIRRIFAVDMSCGPNLWASQLTDDYYSIDIEPPEDAFGEYHTGDWLLQTEESINLPSKDEKVIILGFNPPYGRSSVMARKMIAHGIKIAKPDFICLISPYSVTENIRRWPGLDEKKFVRERIPDFAFRKADGSITWHTSSYIVVADVRSVTNFKWMSGHHSIQRDGFKVATAPPAKYINRVDMAIRTKGSRAGWEFITPEPWQHTLIEPGTDVYTSPIPDDVVIQFLQHASFTVVQFDDPKIITPSLYKKICWEMWRTRGPYAECNSPSIPNYHVADVISRCLEHHHASVYVPEHLRRATKRIAQ